MRLDEGHTGASMTGCRSRTRPSASRFLFIVIISGTGHASGGEEGGWNWMEDQVGQVLGGYLGQEVVEVASSKQQEAGLTATSTSSTRSHLLVRVEVGQAARSSARTRIASFLHSSFLFSISEVGGSQVPRYCRRKRRRPGGSQDVTKSRDKRIGKST